MTDLKKNTVMPMPMAGALLMGSMSALVVGFSFVVISYYPIPASVAPALDFNAGLLWGAVVGGICGMVIGFLVDDSHFEDKTV